MSTIELVCLDLGRVLVRICDDWQQAWALAGVQPMPVIEPRARRQVLAVVERHETGQIDTEQFADEAATIIGVPPGDVLAMSNAWLRGAYPGAVELVKRAAEMNVQAACLSNTNDNHWRLMHDPASDNYLGLEQLTHQFTSHLIGVMKPDPRIYEHVEQATGAAPAQILFFDDDLANLRAARSRGWICEQIDPRKNPPAQVSGHLARYGLTS